MQKEQTVKLLTKPAGFISVKCKYWYAVANALFLDLFKSSKHVVQPRFNGPRGQKDKRIIY